MNNFQDKVAVITGAASGIGRALAEQCVKAGMRIILADIEEEALLQAEKELKGVTADVLAVVTDVSKENDMRLLAEKTLNSFRAIDLLFSNAGVGAGSLLWTSTAADWQWVINVNLWGAINASRIFVPIMLQQQTNAHIVYTASRAGLESGPFNGIYRVTKHAVVGLAETMFHELKVIGARVGVSVLCPGFVRSRIFDAERNRPKELLNAETVEITPPEAMITQLMREAVKNGMDPKQLAEMTFKAVQEKQFYILPDPECKPAVKQRMEDILNERNPSLLIPATLK